MPALFVSLTLAAHHAMLAAACCAFDCLANFGCRACFACYARCCFAAVHVVVQSQSFSSGCMVLGGMQAGQCGRCRGMLGVAGRVCQHCRLDEQFVGWEVRIYSLQTHAMAAGQAVTAEEAIIRVSIFPYL